ncbi:MAG TPA: hypothetical protein VGM81_00755 [Burkholderiaceae bacterium]
MTQRRRVPPACLVLGGAGLIVVLMLALALVWRQMHAPVAGSAVAAAPAATEPEIAAFSPEQLLAEQARNDWLVHRLRGDEAVLVIEFPSLEQQGLALNRVAALIEKKGGSRVSVLNDEQLQALIKSTGDDTATFYFGHDYTAADLARFYTLAFSQGIVLNANETRLRQQLLDASLLSQTAVGQFTGADPGALVTFSATQPNDPRTQLDESVDPLRRASVMSHELSHGRYFTDKTYREHCWFFWTSLLNDHERTLWRNYLATQGYDMHAEDLMVNETQALLMHTPDGRDFNAKELHLSDAELEGLRERFRLGLK